MSERTILWVLRVCLAVWGVLWIGTGIAQVAYPEVLHSEVESPPSSGANMLLAVLMGTFGSVLLITPRFFARHMAGFCLTLLAALALPIMTLALAPVNVRDCLRIAALCFFPVLMQTLLVLHARAQPRAA